MDDGSPKISNVKITPTTKQMEFLKDPTRFLCYSGGFGSGKTVAGCLRALLLSQLMPGNFGLVGRLTYPELRDTTRRSFFELCPPDWYDPLNGGMWKASENHLKLYNGSEIVFRHLDTISQKELLSMNLGWFFIDQAEEISEDVFQTLISRLRKNSVAKRYGFIVCNPEGHNWIYRRFKEQNHSDHKIIDSTTFDNKENLPEDYIESLLKAPDVWKKRYVYGSWDAFEGQIFTEFDRNIHVLRPFEVPREWDCIVAIDHGLVNPTAALLLAIDYDENVFVIDEYYEAGRPISENADAILRMVGKRKVGLWLIDPSTAAKTREKNGMPWSVMEEYNDYGIYPVGANNEIDAGINRLKEFLMPKADRLHPVTQKRGSPRLFIFNHCVNLINEITTYQWKKMRFSAIMRNAPEKPQEYNDHAIDCLRYAIMARWGPTEKQIIGGPQRLGYQPLITPFEDKTQMNEMSRPMNPNFQGDDELGLWGGSSLLNDY